MSDTPRWQDSLGREVDLDDIDREYALNILQHALVRRGRAGYSNNELRRDPLIQKLREVVLNGREPDEADAARGALYNKLNKKAGQNHRAPRRLQRDSLADKYGEGLNEDASQRLGSGDPYFDMIFENERGEQR